MGKLKTVTDLAEENDFTFKTIKSRIKAAGLEPVKVEGRRIFYDSAAANKAIWGRLINNDEDLILEKERALLTIEQRKKLERENKLADGQVAPIEIISEVLARVSKQIASTLDALPLTLKKRNPNLGYKDIELVRKEIAKCRNMAVKAAVDDCQANRH